MRKSRLHAGFFVGASIARDCRLFLAVEVAVQFRVEMPQALFLFAPDGAVKTL
jgi:hypothetical protein